MSTYLKNASRICIWECNGQQVLVIQGEIIAPRNWNLTTLYEPWKIKHQSSFFWRSSLWQPDSHSYLGRQERQVGSVASLLYSHTVWGKCVQGFSFFSWIIKHRSAVCFETKLALKLIPKLRHSPCECLPTTSAAAGNVFGNQVTSHPKLYP